MKRNPSRQGDVSGPLLRRAHRRSTLLASAEQDASLVRGCAQAKGFSLVELLMVLLIGTILTVMAVPILGTVMSSMRVNSMVNAISGAIGKTRYRALTSSQAYTLALNVPANTYIVTNVSTATADGPVPLPSTSVVVNGGANSTYTYTFCPNGTVYGAGGTCSNNPNLPPALAITNQTRQTNISVSTVGNVTTTIIH